MHSRISIAAANMGEFLRTCVRHSLITLVVLIVLGLVIYRYRKYLKTVKSRCFAYLYPKVVNSYREALVAQKKVLFAPLRDFKSLDGNLRKQGLLRILEIGVGPGANFEFYPKNARIIAVDPNPYFKKYVDENKAKFSNIHLERFIQGEGEDLKELEDESVDVVVTTTVLCSVHDLKAVMREIHRVLAPGGTYFFLEHATSSGHGHEHGWHRFAHMLTSHLPFGKNHTNIRTTRNVESAILATGFDKTNFKPFVVGKLPLLMRFAAGPHISGTAQKKTKTT